jgi:adenylylsulfate kinase
MQEQPTSKNIFWHEGEIARSDRERANGHRGVTVWFTGLSGSGKTTLARAVEEAMYERGCKAYVLDGDNVRHGLNRDLGFSPEDRTENIRRIGEVAKLFTDFGAIVLTAFISPYREDRDSVRSLMAEGDFIEVYTSCSLACCEERDPKGLYRKARAGQIPEFTGISAPYEEPVSPELVVHTDEHSIKACVGQLLDYLEANGYLGRAAEAAAAVAAGA